MPIEAHFYKNRCLFNSFHQHTDLSPYSRKPGVNYYLFKIIGALLAKIGFAQKVEYRMSNKSCVIYLNKKSFQKWIVRHQKDAGLDRADLNEARVDEILARIKKRLLSFKYDEALASGEPITFVFNWKDTL